MSHNLLGSNVKLESLIVFISYKGWDAMHDYELGQLDEYWAFVWSKASFEISVQKC